MMGKRFLVLISIIVPMICSGQRTDETIYYAWINKLDRSTTPKGYVIGLREDHVIHINKFKNANDDPLNSPRKTSIPVNSIESLSFRKSGNVGRGMWKGALWGGGTLGLLTVASNNGFISTGQIFTIGFIVGVIPGALIGTAVGAKKMHFYINGDKTAYQQQKEKLNRLLLEM